MWPWLLPPWEMWRSRTQNSKKPSSPTSGVWSDRKVGVYAVCSCDYKPTKVGTAPWVLDEIRIVASPCQELNVGMPENFQRDPGDVRRVHRCARSSNEGRPRTRRVHGWSQTCTDLSDRLRRPGLPSLPERGWNCRMLLLRYSRSRWV